jgi:hypothetical protein
MKTTDDRIAGKLRRDHGGDYDAGHAQAQILLIEPRSEDAVPLIVMVVLGTTIHEFA